MRLESAEEFLKRAQPSTWGKLREASTLIAREMAHLDWKRRTMLFNTVLGEIAETSMGFKIDALFCKTPDPKDREVARQFVAIASAVLGASLLDLAARYGVDLMAPITSAHHALMFASCPIDALANAGAAYFRRSDGQEALSRALDDAENFEVLALADLFERELAPAWRRKIH